MDMGTDAEIKAQSIEQWWRDYDRGADSMSKARLKDTGGADFEPAPAGLTMGRCYQIIDLGTHYNEMYDNYRHQIFIGFELPNEKKTWKDKEGHEQTGPFSIGGFFTMSLSEKSKLRPFLESWRGQAFTEEELAGFDPEKILGIPGMINVIHESKDSKTRAKIASISRLMKGTTCPPAINDTVFFMFEDFSTAAFEKVPDGFKKIIEKSTEWESRMKEAEEGGFVDDDLPDFAEKETNKEEEDIPF